MQPKSDDPACRRIAARLTVAEYERLAAWLKVHGYSLTEGLRELISGLPPTTSEPAPLTQPDCSRGAEDADLL